MLSYLGPWLLTEARLSEVATMERLALSLHCLVDGLELNLMSWSNTACKHVLGILAFVRSLEIFGRIRVLVFVIGLLIDRNDDGEGTNHQLRAVSSNVK